MPLREYRTADQEELIEVWLASSIIAHPFIDKETWLLHTDDLRNKYLPIADTWVWEEGGKIIGFISVIGNYIGGLFILPQWQGKGIGSQLISQARSVKGNLVVGVYDKNERAKQFYSRCGFAYENEEVQQETGEIVVYLRQVAL